MWHTRSGVHISVRRAVLALLRYLRMQYATDAYRGDQLTTPARSKLRAKALVRDGLSFRIWHLANWQDAPLSGAGPSVRSRGDSSSTDNHILFKGSQTRPQSDQANKDKAIKDRAIKG